MKELTAVLDEFAPISLEEMESVKLMNRIDTKFVMPMRDLPTLLEMAKPAYFAQQIDGKRIASYDTTYYDTEDLDMYIRHHDRQLVRQKIRIRTYIESHLNFLEIKRKNNKGRTKKKRIPLPSNEIACPNDEVKTFIASKSRYRWEDIQPRLKTIFRRITLVNKEKTERLTIDMDLQFVNIRAHYGVTFPELVIVELKRDGNVSSPMLNIMQTMRIKPLKISKYCVGTALTNPDIKRNRFKKKVRSIKKTLHDELQNI